MTELTEIIRQCCIPECRAFNFPDYPEYWVWVSEAERHTIEANHKISHTYCPSCFPKEMAKIRAERRHYQFLEKAKQYFKV